MEENKNKTVKILIDSFEDIIEDKSNLTPEDTDNIIAVVKTKEELQDGLTELRDKANLYKQKTEECANKIKAWQESKKMWESRSKSFLKVLESLIGKLGISDNTVKANGVKLSISSRTCLEVDEQWLLAKYQNELAAFQSRLPDYITASISVDKTKLFAHVKADKSMLIQNPVEIHTKTSTSTSIK